MRPAVIDLVYPIARHAFSRAGEIDSIHAAYDVIMPVRLFFFEVVQQLFLSEYAKVI
jgi:hypothetical protein